MTCPFCNNNMFFDQGYFFCHCTNDFHAIIDDNSEIIYYSFKIKNMIFISQCSDSIKTVIYGYHSDDLNVMNNGIDSVVVSINKFYPVKFQSIDKNTLINTFKKVLALAAFK